MVLHNTTRGDDALISNCVTGTNTITLTANVPGTWQVGDTITSRSQTNTTAFGGGTVYFSDFEFTAGIETDSALFVASLLIYDTAAAGQALYLHPYEAYSAAKLFFHRTQVSSLSHDGITPATPIDLTTRRFTMAWTTAGSNTLTIILNLFNEGVTIG
jgi:hypothetical protein